MSQTIDSNLDDDKKCKNYPHGKFSSYRKCDEAFVRKMFVHKYKLMPFWVANHMEEVTVQRCVKCIVKFLISFSISYFSFHIGPSDGDYLDGTYESLCPRPCLTTKVSIYPERSLFTRRKFKLIVKKNI